MSRYSDQTLDQYERPIAGATIYVYDSEGSLASLTDDDGDPLDNPITSDEFGSFYFHASDDIYTLRYVVDGVTVFEQSGVVVGLGPEVDQAIALAITQAAEPILAAAAASAAEAEAAAEIAGSGGPRAVLLVTYGQSLREWQAHQVTTAAIPNLYQFQGGVAISQFAGFSDPTSNRDVTQPFSNYASIVPFAPRDGLEIMAAGIGAQILQEPYTRACLIFSPGYSGQSARMLRQGLNLFRDLENGLCEGVRRLEELGYVVDIRFVWNQGHANADAINDGLGGGETPTSVAQYVTILTKMRDAFWRAARTATGLLVSPTIWVVPLQTGNTLYPAANVRDIQEAQRQAVATLPGFSFTPPYSQFANDFQTDLVHPYGEAIRPHGEAVGIAMRGEVSPPLMTAATIVNSTTVDVTFNQDVALSATLIEATGYANDAMGFQALTSGGAYVNVTAATHPTAPNKIRLTVATGTLAGGKILNGQQWNATGPAATYMPRTHTVGTTPIGTALDGTILENFSIPQAIVLS
jgi:hypothetical protein